MWPPTSSQLHCSSPDKEDFILQASPSKIPTCAMILAAGLGARMKSHLPKVLHPICGRPLIYFPVKAAIEAKCDEIVVVVGHGKEQVTAYLRETFGDSVKTAVQISQLGTGDAAKSGLSEVSDSIEKILLYYGDMALVEGSDLAVILGAANGASVERKFNSSNRTTLKPIGLVMGTCFLAQPFGYGRILRDKSGQIINVREQKDLRSKDEEKIEEVNLGIYCCSKSFLDAALHSLKPSNAQQEYYLTDIVSFAVEHHYEVSAVSLPADKMEGINDREQLFRAEKIRGARILSSFRKAGVTIQENAFIEDGVELAEDVVIEAGVVLRGKTSVAKGTRIDVGSVLTDVTVGENVWIKPYTIAEKARIDSMAKVGPFSHLRPETHIETEAHVGNFVELKKTKLGKKSKANHLAYLGDGQIGDEVNVGAGVILCNFDGRQKHVTKIEDGAFIGSDSHLIAPVSVGKRAYVATGTTVTKNVPDDALAIGRVKQENREGYASRLLSKPK